MPGFGGISGITSLAMCKNANKPPTKNDLLDAALDSEREREREGQGSTHMSGSSRGLTDAGDDHQDADNQHYQADYERGVADGAGGGGAVI